MVGPRQSCASARGTDAVCKVHQPVLTGKGMLSFPSHLCASLIYTMNVSETPFSPSRTRVAAKIEKTDKNNPEYH